MKKYRHKLRLLVVAGFFLLLFFILCWRMLDLTVLHRQFLKNQGDARSLRLQDLPAYRGQITDRQGIPLAVSTLVQSVWVNPKEFAPSSTQLLELAKILHTPGNELKNRISRSTSKEFLYLKRQLPPMIAQKIELLKIPGVNLQYEFKRYYPEGDSTAQLVGFTNVDDIGIEGLELAYQEWLMGIPGKKRVVKDRTGRIIEELDVLKEAKPGNDLVLSIDRRIQYLAYHELQKTVERFSAKAGSVIVLDTQTGEVLAAANYPSFNPNARERYTRDSYRNKAFTDSFEPGSVIKPFTVASALDVNLITPQTIIDTRPSWMIVHGHTIRDDHSYGVLDVTGVLLHSSNVGVTKMTLLSPPDQLIGLFQRSGFGLRTESGYPGESEGYIVKAKNANPFVQATLSFGYGVSVTALQLAKAYQVFANKGKVLPITLLRSDKPEGTQKVMEEKTANQVLTMLEAVTNEGTGQLAKIPGFRVAGKTGTARIAGKKGYEANRHVASFVGIAPVSHPRLVVVVVVHEPTRSSYYAAAVAAPLFAQVMAGSLRTLDIMPDKTTG